MYRQLFLWIVTGNLTIVIVAAAGAFPWGHKHRVQFTAANILISVLARNEVCNILAVRKCVVYPSIEQAPGAQQVKLCCEAAANAAACTILSRAYA